MKAILRNRDYGVQSVVWLSDVSSFSTKQMDIELRGEKTTVSWRKLRFGNVVRPRACFIACLAWKDYKQKIDCLIWNDSRETMCVV